MTHSSDPKGTNTPLEINVQEEAEQQLSYELRRAHFREMSLRTQLEDELSERTKIVAQCEMIERKLHNCIETNNKLRSRLEKFKARKKRRKNPLRWLLGVLHR